MARKRRKSSMQAGELNLTAMIDVAFQMLAFFIITVKPVDVMAQLDVFRPATPPSERSKPPPIVIRIVVAPGGDFAINGHAVDRAGLDQVLAHMADLDKTQSVLVACNADSQHADLIAVLDTCAKVGLSNLSVVSSN